MRRVCLVGLVIVVVLVPGMALASSAFAVSTEGPFYAVEGQVFGEGEGPIVTATVKQLFRLKSASDAINCSGVRFSGGSKIIGSSVKSASGSNVIIEYTGCTVTGNGAACSVQSSKITTNNVVGTLGYATSNRTGPILDLFTPETGKVLATIKFTGTCTLASAALTGTAVSGEISSGKVVEVGKNETEQLRIETSFSTLKKAIWTESNSTLKETKASLELAGVSATLEGAWLQEVAGGENWDMGAEVDVVGPLYRITPDQLRFGNVLNNVKKFKIENLGTASVVLKENKIGGAEKTKFAFVNEACVNSVLILLEACMIEIKLKETGAGGATYEGGVEFEGGATHRFTAKLLTNP